MSKPEETGQVKNQVDNIVSSKLTNSDHWFCSNLECLIGGEKAIVNKGIRENIDRKMLAKWVKKNC